MSWLDELQQKYTGDRFFEEVFKNNMYKPAFDIGEVDTVLDIGALAGEFSFYMYDHAKHIYALEPVDYEELHKNVKDFKLDKIKTFPLAMSDTNGVEYMKLQGRGGHTLVPEKGENTIEVPTITLNKFLNDNNIESVDILKIDIEDAEIEVFTAPDIDEAMKKVKFMIGEHGNLDIIRNFGFEVTKNGGIWTAQRK